MTLETRDKHRRRLVGTTGLFGEGQGLLAPAPVTLDDSLGDVGGSEEEVFFFLEQLVYGGHVGMIESVPAFTKPGKNVGDRCLAREIPYRLVGDRTVEVGVFVGEEIDESLDFDCILWDGGEGTEHRLYRGTIHEII
jgi:hypothetical protein